MATKLNPIKRYSPNLSTYHKFRALQRLVCDLEAHRDEAEIVARISSRLKQVTGRRFSTSQSMPKSATCSSAGGLEAVLSDALISKNSKTMLNISTNGKKILLYSPANDIYSQPQEYSVNVPYVIRRCRQGKIKF